MIPQQGKKGSVIFLTVGTHPAQFDRLLKEIDRLLGKGAVKEDVFAQTGHSAYKPKSRNLKCKKFVSLDEFNRLVESAGLVITHGGEGSIGAALQQEKPMVVVPRLKRFGEHTNDHQLELTRAVEEEGAAVAVYDIAGLGDAIAKAKKLPKRKTEHAKGIIKLIENFVKVEKLA